MRQHETITYQRSLFLSLNVYILNYNLQVSKWNKNLKEIMQIVRSVIRSRVVASKPQCYFVINIDLILSRFYANMIVFDPEICIILYKYFRVRLGYIILIHYYIMHVILLLLLLNCLLFIRHPCVRPIVCVSMQNVFPHANFILYFNSIQNIYFMEWYIFSNNFLCRLNVYFIYKLTF